MNKSIANSILLLSSIFAADAWAGGETGLYVGASLGQSSVEENVEVLNSNYKLKEEDTGYKILGGINFGVVPLLNLAIEIDYRDFGTFEENYTHLSANVTSTDIFAVAGFNIGPGSVFAKIGYFDADVEYEWLGDTEKSSETGNAYGVGAQFQLASVAIRAEYETFDVDDIDDLSMFSVGATYTF